MHQDEKDIVEYLKGWPNTFVPAREIARKVGGRERLDQDRGWALAVLAQMVRDGSLESDHLGGFRLRLKESNRKKKEKHVSPQILRILKSSGKSFEGLGIDEDMEQPPPHRKPSTSAGG